MTADSCCLHSAERRKEGLEHAHRTQVRTAPFSEECGDPPCPLGSRSAMRREENSSHASSMIRICIDAGARAPRVDGHGLMVRSPMRSRRRRLPDSLAAYTAGA